MDTSLLHPMIVHFPIALLIVAFAFDLAGLIARRTSLTQAALYCQVLGALGAVAAYLTGERAEEAVEHLASAHTVLERHEDLGRLLMYAAIAVAVIRIGLVWKRKADSQGAKALLAAFSLGLVFLVGATGFFGGQLVYNHGAGVAPIMQQLPARGSDADEH